MRQPSIVRKQPLSLGDNCLTFKFVQIAIYPLRNLMIVLTLGKITYHTGTVKGLKIKLKQK